MAAGQVCIRRRAFVVEPRAARPDRRLAGSLDDKGRMDLVASWIVPIN